MPMHVHIDDKMTLNHLIIVLESEFYDSKTNEKTVRIFMPRAELLRHTVIMLSVRLLQAFLVAR